MGTERNERTDAPAGARRPGERPADIVLPVDADRVRAMLERIGLPWFVDHEGDLGILWRRGTVRLDVWHTGEQPSVLLVSASWHRRPTIERLGDLMELADEWNAGGDGLKTYLRVLDDGDVLVCFETSLLVRAGASEAQLTGFLHRTVSGIFDLVARLEAHFPDPVAQPEDDL